MMISDSNRNVFVLIYIMISFVVIILLVATPIVAHLSFADKIYPIRPGATLALGCDLVNDKDFATSTEFSSMTNQTNRDLIAKGLEETSI